MVSRSLSIAKLLILYTELLSYRHYLYWHDIVTNVCNSDCLDGVRVTPVTSTNWYPVNFGLDSFLISTNLCLLMSSRLCLSLMHSSHVYLILTFSQLDSHTQKKNFKTMKTYKIILIFLRY